MSQSGDQADSRLRCRPRFPFDQRFPVWPETRREGVFGCPRFRLPNRSRESGSEFRHASEIRQSVLLGASALGELAERQTWPVFLEWRFESPLDPDDAESSPGLRCTMARRRRLCTRAGHEVAGRRRRAAQFADLRAMHFAPNGWGRCGARAELAVSGRADTDLGSSEKESARTGSSHKMCEGRGSRPERGNGGSLLRSAPKSVSRDLIRASRMPKCGNSPLLFVRAFSDAF